MLSRRTTGHGALAVLAAVLLVAAAPAAEAKESRGGPTRALPAAEVMRQLGPSKQASPPAQLARRGYMVADPAALRAAKARAAQRAAASSSAVRRPSALGAVTSSWTGLSDPEISPPDTTGAIGPDRYIELVNTKFGIYDRDTTALIGTGSLESLYGVGAGAFVSDPQVIWDPGRRRFFYAGLVIADPNHNYIAVGYSKSAHPGSASGFCRYLFGYGPHLPDFPKLGDTANFMLVGVNTFFGNFYEGSDVVWVKKPGRGRRCQRSLRGGAKINLRDGADGPKAFTPVPANQVDSSSLGWIVGTPAPGGTDDHLIVFRVKKNRRTGNAKVQRSGRDVPVADFKVPPQAPQDDPTYDLDTLDGRLTQAVAAKDPSRTPQSVIWTQHTVGDTSGPAEVHWYEIAPGPADLDQEGEVAATDLHYFNGAISPDRAVSGGVGSFGDSMLLTFNSSSESQDPAVGFVSKTGGGAQSAPATVMSSAASLSDFSCGDPIAGLCRWGDYAGASPDPNPTGGSAVWMSNQWVDAGGGWQTQNFFASP